MMLGGMMAHHRAQAVTATAKAVVAFAFHRRIIIERWRRVGERRARYRAMNMLVRMLAWQARPQMADERARHATRRSVIRRRSSARRRE